MSNQLETAKRQLAEQEREANSLRLRADMAENAAHRLRAVVEWLEANESPTKADAGGSTTLTARINREAKAYINAYGKPASIGNLYQHMKHEGIVLSGKDEAVKRMNLSGFLNRDHEFTFHKGRGWWFSGMPLPLEG